MQLVPFNLLDDTFHNIERSHEPWSIHFELKFERNLEPSRLSDSIRYALSHHPIARARKAPSNDGTTQFYWEIPEQPDQLPLTVIKANTETDIVKARDQLISLSVPTSLSPAFLIYLVQHESGDRLMMNINHTVADGMSMYRILSSILRHYAGEPDPVPDFDPTTVRDLKKLSGTTSIADFIVRAKVFLKHLAASAIAPARVHAQAANNAGQNRRGYSCVFLTLNAEETRQFMARRVKPATVNDLVLAGMLLSIARWNHQHGAKAKRVSAMMPMNLRPLEWWFEVVGNFSSYVSINLPADQQENLMEATRVVQEQTSHLKAAGAASILIDILDIPKGLPAILKARLRELSPTLGRNLVDSTWVTNLGRLADLPVLSDAGRVTEIAFSPPAPEPMNITVGVASLGDTLSLCLRYRKSVLAADSAQNFAELLKATLLEG